MPEFSPEVLIAWRLAAIEAADAKYPFIQREHLMMGLTKLEGALSDEGLGELIENPATLSAAEAEIRRVTSFFASQKLDSTTIRRRLRQLMGTGPSSESDPGTMHRDSACREVFNTAQSYAETPSASVSSFHLMAALLAKPGVRVAQAIASSGGDIQILQKAILKELSLNAPPAPVSAQSTDPPIRSGMLARFGVDLTELAATEHSEALVGRRAELLQMVRTLTRKTKRNPLLLGDPGVGKTAIVRALALRIIQKKVPAQLQDKRIIELNVGALVAGTKYRGDFESRITGIISEAVKDPDVILFIDEIHTLVSAGSAEGSLDAANLLKPALSGSELCVIGSTTTAEYRKYFEKDAALARRFQPILINEPSPAEAVKILAGCREFYEKHHGVRITPAAIKSAVELGCRYFPDRKLPDKALDLLDEACARLKVSALSFRSSSGGLPELPSLGGELVAEVVAERTGIPVTRLSAAGQEKLQQMAQVLNERVIGQPEAVDQVTRLVTMSRAGLRDPRKPIGVLMFVGPTGAGKTELCKALAEFLFGSEADMIRMDMSEYKEKHSVSKLIGSPPGYVGHDEEGQLTGRIRRKPYSVVLLDEIEKAHPEVCDLFLQLFDEGKLTDSHGRTADGRNAIYIMTSNVAVSPDANKRIGFGVEGPADPAASPGIRKQLEERLLREFRPEFLNRIDEIVSFQPLSLESIQTIAATMLRRIAEALANRGVEVRFSPEAVELIAKAGYDPANGARPLARVIDRMVNGPLSQKTVAGEIKSGDCVEVLAEDGRLSFRAVAYGGAAFPTV